MIPLLLFGAYLIAVIGKFMPFGLSQDWPVFPFVLLLLLLKYKRKNIGMRSGIVYYLVITAIISIVLYFQKYDGNLKDTVFYFIPLFGMSLGYAFFSWKVRDSFHKWIPGLYLFSVFLVFFVYFIFGKLSPLIIGIIWLCLSLIFLESPLLLNKKNHEFIRHYLHIGYFYILLFLVRFIFIDMQSEQLLFWIVKARPFIEIFGVLVFIYWMTAKNPVYYRYSAVFKLVNPLMLELAALFVLFSLFIEVRQNYMSPVLMVYAIVTLLLGRYGPPEISRLKSFSVIVTFISAFYTAFVTSPYISPSLHFYDEAWIYSITAIVLQFAYLVLVHNMAHFNKQELPPVLSWLEKSKRFVIRNRNYIIYYPVFISVALFLIWSFDKSLLTILLTTEVFMIFGLSIIIRENHFRYLSMAGLLGCLARLVFFDLTKTGTITKAIVCILVAVLMIGMNILYNKFKKRFGVKAGENE